MKSFKKLLLDQGDERASVMRLKYSHIKIPQASRLQSPFSEEEVRATPFELNGDKA